MMDHVVDIIAPAPTARSACAALVARWVEHVRREPEPASAAVQRGRLRRIDSAFVELESALQEWLALGEADQFDVRPYVEPFAVLDFLEAMAARRQQAAAFSSLIGPGVRTYPDQKRVAALGAYNLLSQFGGRVSKSEDGDYYALAAALYGEAIGQEVEVTSLKRACDDVLTGGRRALANDEARKPGRHRS